jgi:hypothetical protein
MLKAGVTAVGNAIESDITLLETRLVQEGGLTLPVGGAMELAIAGLLYTAQKFGPLDIKSVSTSLAGTLHFVNEVGSAR